MDSRELKSCVSDSNTPPPAAHLAIATIERYLREGATPEQVARAMAEVSKPRQPRQGSLPL